MNEKCSVTPNTALDVSQDEALVLALAREEMDRALALQLSGNAKPTYLPYDLTIPATSAASSVPMTGGWVPGDLLEPSSTTMDHGPPQMDLDHDPEAGSSSPGSCTALAQPSPLDVAIRRLYLLVHTRALLVSLSAAVLAGLAMVYLLECTIFKYWIIRPRQTGYYGWRSINIALAVLYGFVVVLAVIGSLGSRRLNVRLVTIYCVGLSLATIIKLILSLIVNFSLKDTLRRMQAINGCWSSTQTVSKPWTDAQCRQFQAEAMADAWLWIFPLLLCLIHVCCAAWLRMPLVRYDALVKQRRRREPLEPAGSASPTSTVDLEPPPVPLASIQLFPIQPTQPGRRVRFNEESNNARIQQEFNLSSSKPLDPSAPQPVPEPQPRETVDSTPRHGQPTQEHVTFIPICLASSSHTTAARVVPSTASNVSPAVDTVHSGADPVSLDLDDVFLAEAMDTVPPADDDDGVFH